MARIRLKNKNYVKKERVVKPPVWQTKRFWLTVVLLYALWIFGLRRPVYQLFYGSAAEQPVEQMAETWEETEGQQWQKTTAGGYEIRYKVRQKYTVLGRIVYVDWYQNFIGTWYRSAMSVGTYLYDAVVPVDVSVIHGATAAEDNWRKLKFSHEERLLWSSYRYGENTVFNRDEINNNHVIPASQNILRALKIVKIGEPVYIEGYLIDWTGTGKYADYKFNTAVTPGEFSKEKVGGLLTGLCRQIFVTKIAFGGYVFE
ncbi:MAG: hypothetical protein IJ752_01650 [Alphaproteobacteria bacterium]|nr:hypothetical protein [Alphaproteobacteria bacterium]